jgi:hypothetical protein
MSFGYYGSFLPVNTGTQTYFSAVKWSPYSTADNTILYLGTQSGQLFRVQHVGSTPVATEITGPGFPAANLSCIDVLGSEDTLLVTFSNYGVTSVFATFDGGQNWKNSEGDLPDMPVRWGLFHPQNAKQVMLATETGIWTTSNLDQSGVTWKPDVAGMANVRVDMLNLREADNTVLAATHGRGCFTTTWDVISGIEKPDNFEFKIFPNPVQDLLNISASGSGLRGITLKMYDSWGKIIFEETEKSPDGNWAERIDLTGRPGGIYVVAIFEGEKMIRSVKVIKM